MLPIIIKGKLTKWSLEQIKITDKAHLHGSVEVEVEAEAEVVAVRNGLFMVQMVKSLDMCRHVTRRFRRLSVLVVNIQQL